MTFLIGRSACQFLQVEYSLIDEIVEITNEFSAILTYSK